jgi:hypothetical protein
MACICEADAGRIFRVHKQKKTPNAFFFLKSQVCPRRVQVKGRSAEQCNSLLLVINGQYVM